MSLVVALLCWCNVVLLCCRVTVLLCCLVGCIIVQCTACFEYVARLAARDAGRSSVAIVCDILL